MRHNVGRTKRNQSPSPRILATCKRTYVRVASGCTTQGTAEIATEANIVWNMGDANYWLRATMSTEVGSPRASDSKADSDALDGLMQIAGSIVVADGSSE